jgi:antitoxin component YwqK of YwqJK toxin-antitoxin module
MRTFAFSIGLPFACALLGACTRSPEQLVEAHYPNGRLASVRGYTRGEKDGLHRGWWPSGASQFECRYANGNAVGTCREWYADGRPASVHRYVDGAESGLQQGWGRAGEPQFSYDVRGGRRYGLLGALNCKTGARAPGAI